MTGELSAVLDHIEKISALDLDGVPPTTHVVDVRTRCGPTCRARACRARSRWRSAPAVDDDGFRVPSPQAG